MEFYPSRIQWAVIWGVALAALWMWIKGGPYPPTPLQTHDRRIIAVVVIGALAVWMLSDMEKLRDVVGWDDPKHRRSAIALAILVGVSVVYLMGVFGTSPAPVVSLPRRGPIHYTDAR